MAQAYTLPLPTKTQIYSVDRAMDFFNKANNLWICLGKQTSWQASDYGNVQAPSDMDDNPPSPDPTATSVIEPIGYKKIAAMYFVTPYINGQTVPVGQQVISYGSSQWLTVDSSLAYEQVLTTLEWDIDIFSTDFPSGPFRQIGLFSNLQMASGVDTNLEVLTPSQVSNPGYLEMLDNRPISYLNTSTNRIHISYVMTN